jgi:hypothetical protein
MPSSRDSDRHVESERGRAKEVFKVLQRHRAEHESHGSSVPNPGRGRTRHRWRFARQIVSDARQDEVEGLERPVGVLGQHQAVAIEVALGRPQRAFLQALENEEAGAADRADQREGDRAERAERA